MALSLEERRKIDKHQGKLVESAEEIVRNANEIWNKLDRSQFQNVAGVATSAECVPVVTNFIKYQIGRKKSWSHQNFGMNIIEQMENLEAKAKSVAGNKASEDKVDEIWIELCRSFWGYVIRYTKFRGKGGQD